MLRVLHVEASALVAILSILLCLDPMENTWSPFPSHLPHGPLFHLTYLLHLIDQLISKSGAVKFCLYIFQKEILS